MINCEEILVNDRMQTGYLYRLTTPPGEQFDLGFEPHYSPREMLEMGVFEGKYLNDCSAEFPASWLRDAKLSDHADAALNYFGMKSRQSLSTWREKGWIVGPDPRGWFQWYCRYYMGRRCEDDARQISRWKAMTRHIAQVRKNCMKGDLLCRARQRQALLHWAYDSRNF